MKKIFLEGKTIYLRSIEESDLTENYQQWFNDVDVCQFNSHHRFPNYRQNMEDYYREVIRSHAHLVLAIVDKETDRHIGNISLQDIDLINRTAELAIIVGDKSFWGRGVGKEAGHLIIHHGFSELNLNRIYCGTSKENIGMIKLAAALGMKEEGVSRQALYKHGVYHDSIHFGVLRDDYITTS